MSLDVLDPLVDLPCANYPVMDPVCGMAVRIREAPAHSDFGGERHYFCSASCKREFEQNPGQYAGAEGWDEEETEAETSQGK